MFKDVDLLLSSVEDFVDDYLLNLVAGLRATVL